MNFVTGLVKNIVGKDEILLTSISSFCYNIFKKNFFRVIKGRDGVVCVIYRYKNYILVKGPNTHASYTGI